MRHNAKVSTFGRKSGPRKALLRGMVYSLVEHGRITTTLARAKELRRHVERAITLGKDNTLHARRLLLARYPNDATVAKLMGEISPAFKTRPGGYTRVLRVGMRPGDKAEMAIIQFVNYKVSEKPEVDEKAVKAAKKKSAAAAKAKKKHKRRLTSAARAVLRKHLK